MNDRAPMGRLLTQKQVARFFGVTERTVRRWVAAGLLRQVTLAGSNIARYRPGDVEALLGEGQE